MKKLIVGITAPGSVGLLRGQMRYFKELGYDTYLMSPKNERSVEYCKNEGCTLLEIKIEREISFLKDFGTLIRIIRILRRVRPDIVNFGTPKMGLLGSIAAKLVGINCRIDTCRGLRYEHEKGIKRWMLKKLERVTGICAHYVICISPSVKEVAVREHLFAEKKCVVINKGSSNGIDNVKFDRNSVPENLKQELKIELELNSHFVYGFIGRLIDHKGILELYNAFCRIYIKDNNSRLLVVGPVELSQIADVTLIDKMKSHEAIIMPGRTDNVPLYLSLMDVFVLPSWREGFGNVLVEAAAMGIPVISSTGTGCRDAVSDGFNGILVNPKDDIELEKAMEELKENGLKRAVMGNNGIEWAKNFSSKIIWDGINQLYTSR